MTRFKDAHKRGIRRASMVGTGIVALSAIVLMSVGGAFGASVTGVTVTGGAGTLVVNNAVYAKQGQSVRLGVTTDADTKCVALSGAHSGNETTPQSHQGNTKTWTFNRTAGIGDGVQRVTIAAYKGSGNTDCGGQSNSSKEASYVLDNTGPTVTAQLTPANGAGWHRSNVDINWSATDPVGIGSGPTPETDSQTANTTGVTKTSTATDKLGNSASGSVTIKLDRTAPAITGSRAPAPNADGWNNTDVKVSFLCDDGSLSGIKACPSATTLTSSAANQSVTGKATDNADNESSATVGAINIDKVAPDLSGAPTTAPNGNNGWYRTSVVIDWTCADALSGIAGGSCPADSTIAGEGQDLTAGASVSDKAGNQRSATSSPAVKIDRTPPTTTASAVDGVWNNSDVTVALDGDDLMSGPAGTYFKIGSGAVQDYSSVNKPSFSQDGVYTLEFWSVDRAGNEEPHNSIKVKIDKTKPTITHKLSPAANLAGWNNADTTVRFLCDDTAGSGITSCSDDVAVVTEGVNPITGTAVDVAGNDVSETFDVRLDKTAPSIVASADRAANAAGWYRDDVTVSFSCADVKPTGVAAVSGLASCPVSNVLGEGADQSASGTATDTAGNSASTTLSKINVDKTDPALSGAATSDPNAKGWYRSDVVVAWTCSDSLSGIDGSCPADSRISGEGDDLSATRSVNDLAGNSKTSTVGPIKVDRTAPSTSASVPEAPASGWYAGDVEVTLAAVDSLSDVDRTFYTVGDDGPVHTYGGPFKHALKGTHKITFWSVDNAGNTEDRTAPGHTIVIKIDGTPPSIKGTRTPPANGFGWANGDVTVSFTCSDAESGLESCDSPVTLSNEGEGQAVTGKARDVAGNVAQDTVSDISIDMTAPTLSGEPTTPANAAGWYRDDVEIRWTAADGLSGIDPATVPADSTITGEGRNLGAGPVSVSDKAGNVTSASRREIDIDRAGPVISGAATTAPNADGWYNGEVVVAFSCADPQLADGVTGSGVAACPSDKVLSGDGADQSVTSAPAKDVAGNSTAGRTVGPFNIDGHKPQTRASLQCTSKNEYCQGKDATVVLSATDVGPSGVKEIRYSVNGGDEQTASGDAESVIVPLGGSGTAKVAYRAVDRAGNVELAGTAELKYDNIAPKVTHALDPNANAAGWSMHDTTVRFSATDDFSGVDESTITPDVLVDEETGGRLIEGKADDKAGNTGTDPVTVRLDKTAPTISGAPTTSPDSDGWYRGPVTVEFTCSDALSDIAVCPDDVTLTGNGADQSVERTAKDRAGNGKSATVGGIKIDSAKPTVEVKGVESGAIYKLGAVPAASCAATDAHSGVAGSCSVSVTGGLANGVGKFTYTASASDRAGNTETLSGSYRVIYRWDGYMQPINDTAHQTGTSTSVFKAASTVPAKLRLRKADGSVVQANTLPEWLMPAKGGLMTTAVDESVYSDPATSGSTYRWDSTDQQYIYNWGTTKSQAGYYWRVGVKLDDGQTYTVNIGLR